MYAVIYRYTIREGSDDQFRAGWRALVNKIYTECGSLGARLHRESATTFLGYHLWPSEQAWSIGAQVIDSFVGGTNFDEAVDLQQELLFALPVTDDLLNTRPFAGSP